MSVRIRQEAARSFPPPAALAGDFSALDSAACQANGVARVIDDPATGKPLPDYCI